MYYLPITASSGAEVLVPCSIPLSISCDMFLPGKGIVMGVVHLDRADPATSDVRGVELLDRQGVCQLEMTPERKGPAYEQANDFLDLITGPLYGPRHVLPNEPWRADVATLLAVADLGAAESSARSALERLPNDVFAKLRHFHALEEVDAVITANGMVQIRLSGNSLAARALAAFVDVLVERAQVEMTRRAKRRHDAYEETRAEERAQAAAAARTDTAIDALKDSAS